MNEEELTARNLFLEGQVTGLNSRVQNLEDVIQAQRDQMAKTYQKVLDATCDHEGCYEGKKSFLEEVGVPEHMWPTKAVEVSFTVAVSVPCFGDAVPDESDIIEEARDSLDDAYATVNDSY